MTCVVTGSEGSGHEENFAGEVVEDHVAVRELPRVHRSARYPGWGHFGKYGLRM